MTRQEQITLEQVLCKKNDAISRCLRELELASDAEDHEEFMRHMNTSTKAANDADVWHRTYNSLKQIRKEV